jgi:hypothetical protein
MGGRIAEVGRTDDGSCKDELVDLLVCVSGGSDIVRVVSSGTGRAFSGLAARRSSSCFKDRRVVVRMGAHVDSCERMSSTAGATAGARGVGTDVAGYEVTFPTVSSEMMDSPVSATVCESNKAGGLGTRRGGSCDIATDLPFLGFASVAEANGFSSGIFSGNV